MKVEEAAKILGVSKEFVRAGLQYQRLPFGTAVKMSSRWSYHISDNLFWKYVGEMNKE